MPKGHVDHDPQFAAWRGGAITKRPADALALQGMTMQYIEGQVRVS
jgi:hypothetical protein